MPTPGVDNPDAVNGWLHNPAHDYTKLIQGIDVSNLQGTIDWHKVAGAGVKFAICKVTEGTNFADPDYIANVKGATAAGIHAFNYFFAHPAESFQGQLSFIRAKAIGPQTELDLEVNDGMTWPQLEQFGKQYFANNPSALLYSNLDYLSHLRDAPWGHQLWLAEYGVPWPARPCTVWQYGAGTVPGISTPCDLDYFMPNQAAFDAWAVHAYKP